MKRNWTVIRLVLSHIEAGDLQEWRANMADEEKKLSVPQGSIDGHLRILMNAGLVKGAEFHTDTHGVLFFSGLETAFITMEGHDLLDALRDDEVWGRIKERARRFSVAVSWEFIKAAAPVVLKEIVA